MTKFFLRAAAVVAVFGSVAVLPVTAGTRVLQYTEVQITPPRMPATGHMQPASSAPAVSWTTPGTWDETPGSGMRLASFEVQGTSATAVASCSIIVLVGTAGGPAANVSRWMGQLNVSLPDGETLEAFLESQTTFETEGGSSGLLVDLTALQPDQPELDSMVAGMVLLDGRTVFLKLMGPRGVLQTERDNLLALCKSVR